MFFSSVFMFLALFVSASSSGFVTFLSTSILCWGAHLVHVSCLLSRDNIKLPSRVGCSTHLAENHLPHCYTSQNRRLLVDHI